MSHSRHKCLLLVLALCLLLGCAAQQEQAELLQLDQQRQTEPALETVQTGSLLRSTPGFLNSEVQFAVDTQVLCEGLDGWVVEETYVQSGDEVTAGQTLALLRPQTDAVQLAELENTLQAEQLRYDAQRAQCSAQVEACRADLAAAPAGTAEARRCEVALARAQYASSLVSDEALEQARQALQRYTQDAQGREICATETGTLTSMLRPGEAVTAQTALCRIYSPDELLLVTQCVNDAAWRCGARVTIYLAGKEAGQGTVLSAPDVYGATTGTVIIRPDEGVQLQGAAGSQSAAVSAVQMALEQVLLLPEQAVRNEGGKYYVYLYENGTLHKRYVTVGARGENGEGEACVQIVDGLQAGDAVTLS